ncbi:MAG: metallophosphatase family protein [Proteobacteria bacterium]|nr:metallophosphoesterase family protein [Desulfobacteraceae bacterium]MBU3980760.1 metallophosphatase family protein [Pseudomonadota bacterium]MBU4014305.1 metallophosphatase family protein [Pseudomonadota bacterium]MBU4068932.1 metallophosphatase family protein [Pseudomonadota bacterium]MBU4099776.1 metallophosphatase family protein [Pseudomonadota bacterium]
MSTKIGLISDVHATTAPLRDALSIFQQEDVDIILCAGDIAGYGNELNQTIDLLIKSECRMILGNHDVWLLSLPVDEEEKRVETFFKRLPFVLELTVEEKYIYVVHASPPCSYMRGIKLMDEYGNMLLNQIEQWTSHLRKFEHDVLIVGHTHQVFAEQLGRTLLINPGSTKFNNTCMILSLPNMEVQVLPLLNKTPLKVWNWGMEQLY